MRTTPDSVLLHGSWRMSVWKYQVLVTVRQNWAYGKGNARRLRDGFWSCLMESLFTPCQAMWPISYYFREGGTICFRQNGQATRAVQENQCLEQDGSACLRFERSSDLVGGTPWRQHTATQVTMEGGFCTKYIPDRRSASADIQVPVMKRRFWTVWMPMVEKAVWSL